MSQQEHGEVPRCPSCGAPRLAHAWDCGSCGAVFDAAPQPTGPEAMRSPDRPDSKPAPPPPNPHRTSSARRPSSARRAGSGRRRPAGGVRAAALTTIRAWVADNIAVAVILSFVLYVAVVWLFGSMILGATDSPGAIKRAYRELTGRPLPAGFGPNFAAHFVSRRLVVLDRADRVLLVLYKDEDGATDADLRALAEDALELFEVPWETVRTRTAEIAGGSVEVPVLRLWGEGGPHLYLLPTATTDGERAIEAVLGDPATVLDVVEEMVARR